MIFADEIPIPVGFDNWMANLLCVVAIGVLLITAFRMLMPRPPMDEQLRHMQKELLTRLDKLDDEAADRLAMLRGQLDSEIMRVHVRVDSHGQELFRLKGYVEGWQAHP